MTQLLASGVYAQEKDDVPATDPKSQKLEEVIVTATRREQSVRDIPVSIDVFSGDSLDSRGLDSLSDMLRYSPGVYVQPGSTPDAEQINIRGGSSSAGDFNRPFGIFYDDVPMINPTFIGTQPEFDPFDMATVEVLKGPQGTLFGGSALLGAIRYVPNRPSLDATYGSLSYGYGSTDGSGKANQQGTAMLNLAANDRFALRLAGSVRDRAGVIDDTFTGEKDVDSVNLQNYRAIATWRIVDPLTASFSYQDRHMKSDANVASAIDNDHGDQVNGRRRGGPDGSVSDQQIYQFGLNWEATDALDLSLDVSRTVKNGHLYSSAFVTDIGGVDVVNPFDKHEDGTTQYTYELRAVHDSPTQSDWALLSNWQYVIGLYYAQSDQRMHLQTLFELNNPPPDFPLPNNLLTGKVKASADAEEFALYFDATRKLSERFSLNLGGRLFDQNTPTSLGLQLYGPLAGDPVDPEFVRKETLKDNGFNPKVAVMFDATENVVTYLSAVQGYRYGGINLNLYNSPLVPLNFESDNVWNYELGARTTWLENRLQADFAVFYIDWSNRQTSQRTATDPSVEYIANTGKWKITGGEFVVRTELSHGFGWMINAGYVHSISKDAYINDNGVLVPPNTAELSTPPWNASTLLTYAGQMERWSIKSAVGYGWRDAADSPLLNLPLKAYGTVDAMVSVGNDSWPMAPVLSLDITNLTNSDALAAGTATGPAGSPGRVVSAKTVWPRTIMLNVTFSFGK